MAGSTLLRRVAGIVGRAAGPVVVVRAPGQALPPLPGDVQVVEDAREGRGPCRASWRASRRSTQRSRSPTSRRSTFRCCTRPSPARPRGRGPRRRRGGAAQRRAQLPLGRRLPHGAAARGRPLARAGPSPHGRPGGAAPRGWLDEEAVGPGSLSNLNDPADYAAARRAPPEVRVRGGGAAVRSSAPTLPRRGVRSSAGLAVAVRRARGVGPRAPPGCRGPRHGGRDQAQLGSDDRVVVGLERVGVAHPRLDHGVALRPEHLQVAGLDRRQVDAAPTSRWSERSLASARPRSRPGARRHPRS